MPGIFMCSRDVIQVLESVQQALGPVSRLSSPYWDCFFMEKENHRFSLACSF